MTDNPSSWGNYVTADTWIMTIVHGIALDALGDIWIGMAAARSVYVRVDPMPRQSTTATVVRVNVSSPGDALVRPHA